MVKYFLSAIIMLVASASFGQTAKPKLEDVKNNPKTTANAAKADARLINKKNIADSAMAKPAAVTRKEQRHQSKGKKN
jgi:hypothetical protein